MTKHLPLGIAGAAALVALVASGADEAGASGRRLVNFDRGTMQPVFAADSTGAGTTSYVLDYTASNAVDKGVKPGIRLELRTDTGKTYGDAFDTTTWRAATKALHRKTEPASTASIRSAELAVGASVEGLANFGSIDPNADGFEVRVYGLWDPVYRDRQGRTWSENRVLVLSYARTGDEYDRHYDAIRLVSSKETLDGDRVQLHAK